MWSDTLVKIRIYLIAFYLFGSIIFYFTLEDFHYKKAEQLIKDNVRFSQAIYLYVSQFQKPEVYRLMQNGQISKDYFYAPLMSSTYIISKIKELYKEDLKKKGLHQEVEFKFPSDNPTNPQNKATPFESEIIKKFNSEGIESYEERINYKGKDTIFYALPVRKNTKACLRCHGDVQDAPKGMLDIYGDKNGFGEKEGHIRAINAIYSTVDADNSMLNFLLLIEGLMLIVFLAIYIVVRHFVVELNKKDMFIARQSKFAAMGEMISMIAHQWRQPLTGIGMSADNMLLDIELQDIDEDRFKSNLETMSEQIKYLSHTIDDFKNFFRQDKKFEEVELDKLLNEAYMIINSSIKSSNVEIKESDTQGVVLITKRNDLFQVILNLIKNSIDAFKENDIQERIIDISSKSLLQSKRIFIKDNAGGIPEDIIDRIFDPYFSTKDAKIGTGLGLYMSKMIIENNLGGKLDVKVENDSTTFIIELPNELEA